MDSRIAFQSVRAYMYICMFIMYVHSMYIVIRHWLAKYLDVTIKKDFSLYHIYICCISVCEIFRNFINIVMGHHYPDYIG